MPSIRSFGQRKTTKFTAEIRLSELTAPMILDRPMDGAAFVAYVEHELLPNLTPGDVVVWIIYRRTK